MKVKAHVIPTASVSAGTDASVAEICDSKQRRMYDV